MIKILIADDHPMIREGLKKTLRDEVDMKVVGEAKNGREVLDFVEKNELSVVLMDLTMPELTGFDALKELKIKHPKLPVLILSMHPEDRFAVRALKSGASGYLTKESAASELVNAIRKVAKGGKYITPIVAEQLAFEIGNKSDISPHETLSDREYQIFIMLAEAKPVNEIAQTLCLTLSTVHTYRARIFEKMNLKTNSDIIHYAITNNLIESTLPPA